MNDLFFSLYQTYASRRGDGSAYALTDGRMYRTEAPARADMPYIVMSLISGTIARSFGDGNIEVARIQVDVFDRFRAPGSSTGNSGKRAGEIWEQLESLYENATMPFLDGEFIQMKRDSMVQETIENDVIHLTCDWFLEQQKA